MLLRIPKINTVHITGLSCVLRLVATESPSSIANVMLGALQLCTFVSKVKVKCFMVKSIPVENLLPQNVGSLTSYLQ